MTFNELNDEQKQAVKQEGNVLLTACPGSGKTRVIIHKLAYVASHFDEGCKKKVAAVTFTVRAAEEIFFWKDYITTWASNDIERATSIARQMVTRYGMIPEIGAENFEWEIDRYSWDTKRPFVSDETIKNIDQKVKEILKNAYDTAIKIITENKELHDKIAKDLLEKEELSKEEFDAYFTKES